MIREFAFWTYVYGKKYDALDRASRGKWIYEAPMDDILRAVQVVDSLTEQGVLYLAKYSNKNSPDIDPFFKLDPVLLVYADAETKESVLETLVSVGISPTEWKTDRETAKDWAPDGKLYKKLVEFNKGKNEVFNDG